MIKLVKICYSYLNELEGLLFAKDPEFFTVPNRVRCLSRGVKGRFVSIGLKAPIISLSPLALRIAARASLIISALVFLPLKGGA